MKNLARNEKIFRTLFKARQPYVFCLKGFLGGCLLELGDLTGSVATFLVF